MQEYELVRNGIKFTVRMSEKAAKELKLKPVDRKAAPAPANKSKAPMNKGASNVAPADK